jgi:hypothetical protein
MKVFTLTIALSVLSLFCRSQTYVVSPIAYNPMPFDSGIAVVAPNDDLWGTVQSIGFNFYFFGQPRQSLLVGTNGILSFDLTNANNYCPWQLSDSIPSPNPFPANSIMFPYQDVDISNAGSIRHQVYGSPPNRKFVVSYLNVPYYGSDSSSANPIYCPGNITYTGQVILYEATNNIEMHIHNKPVCTQWNNGLAIMGIVDSSNIQAYVVPGRNATVWTAFDEAWLFSPDSSFQPAPNLNRISGRVFADLNSNCLFDSADYALRQSPVIFSNNDYMYTDMQGYYSKLVDTGTYVFTTANLAHHYYSSLCPAGGSYSVNFPGLNDSSDNNLFADTINQFCQAIVPAIRISSEEFGWLLGTCDTGYVTISCGNLGTVADTARLVLTLNDSTVILNSPVAYTSLGANRYMFDFGVMNPGDNIVTDVMVRFGCDTIGTQYCFSIEATNNPNVPCLGYSTRQSLCQLIGVPFDPNAMYVASLAHSHLGMVLYLQTQANDFVTYLVTFQNTGSAVAHNVKLKIALSSLLDAYTIAPSGASAAYAWLILNDTLIVDFNGIELPDSNSSAQQSHGYFQFQAKPLAGDLAGSLINHTAQIVFDNNAPVITNQSTVEIVDTTVISGIAGLDELHVKVYPNPSNNKIEIVSEAAELKVKDISGRMIYARSLPEGKTTVDVSLWNSGVYFIELRIAGGVKVVRFVRD